MSVFIDGLVIGISIAAPVGPIGMLCIKRTLTEGRACGLLTGLGAATADGAYGLVASAGLSIVTGALLYLGPVLKVGGAIFLAWLGWTTLRATAASRNTDTSTASSLTPVGAFCSSLLLTMTNPMTIFSFIAILGSLGPTANTATAKALLVAGVWTGSCLWWILLTAAVSALRLTPGGKLSRGINVGSGLVLIAFSLKALL